MADWFPDAAKEWVGVSGQQSLILALDDKRLPQRWGRTNLDRDRVRVTIETG
jgi:hypothetical protein